MLALEEQLYDEVADESGGLQGTLAIGASTGPGAHLVPLLLCEFQRAHPELHVALSIWDTQTVSEKVAQRELELGVVGALRRNRSLEFEPLVRDEIVLAVPPGHRAAGGPVRSTSSAEETVIAMQEARACARSSTRSSAAPAYGSATSAEAGARPAGVGEERRLRRLRRHLHLADGDRGRARRGTLCDGPGRGLDPARQIYVVRAKGRPPTRAAAAFLEFAREKTS